MQNAVRSEITRAETLVLCAAQGSKGASALGWRPTSIGFRAVPAGRYRATAFSNSLMYVLVRQIALWQTCCRRAADGVVGTGLDGVDGTGYTE